MNDAEYIGVVSPSNEGHLIVLFDEVGELATKFLLSVDFAFDIIDHLLRDPYEAMMVVDAKARLKFLSPVHEDFFSIPAGEGSGRGVREIIPNSRLHMVMKTGVAEVGQLMQVNGRERIVSRYPIRHRGKIVGAFGRVMFNRLLKKSATRNGFLLAQPAAFGFWSFSADGMRA